MVTRLRVLSSMTAAAVVVLSASAVPTPPAFAKGEPIDCSKRANKSKPECKKHRDDAGDDQLYYSGYWLARAGKYDEALTYLRQARNPEDPRFLTYIGFATRKLGHRELAMDYYGRALTNDPNFVIARAYLGSAYLETGDLAKAMEQRDEIAARCGMACVEHQELAAQIEAYVKAVAAPG
jgi:tetratricopeptide (TPR) repeat protein